MFKENFGKVTLETVTAPKRGLCLQASMENGTRILMDICGMMLADGTNAYFFGNKLIMVTRWGGMSNAEKERTQTGTLTLALHPTEMIQFSMKVGENWGDVMLTLPHCYSAYNNENEPVDEIIFVFTDKYDTDFLISRRVALPPFLQKRLQKAMVESHRLISTDDMMLGLTSMSNNDANKDLWDYVYDVCWEVIAPYDRKARKQDFQIADGVYIEIGGNNKITDIHTYEPPQQEQMSDEVRLYLQLANKGNAEGAYNLGVCYEHGDGVKQDLEKAVAWYRKAADQGYAKAQFNLGVCYTNGYGVEQDQAEAVRLYTLAADQGDMYAQFNLAVCYLQGLGVEADQLTGINYLMQAAQQGHPTAREALHMD